MTTDLELKPKKPEECPSYVGCSAPLCPLDKASKSIIWYPGEPICNAKGLRNLDWVRMQRWLVRKGKWGFFNIEMLSALRRVTNGIDPDSRETVEGWLRKGGHTHG